MGDVNVRNIILDMLIQINEEDKYSNIVIRDALEKYSYLPHEDRAFISRTVLGTVERRITLDYVIDCFSKVRTGRMKPVIRNIIRMGTYQIMYMDSVRDYAACSEAVKLAVKRGFGSLRGFVNGVLRNIERNWKSVSFPDERENLTEHLAVTYSTPEWIVDKWLDCYGRETTENILKSQFNKRKLSIRCNTVKISPIELQKKLEKRGAEVTINPYVKEAMEISRYDSLDRLPEFDEGLFFVQDVSSMLVSYVANPPSKSHVIDICAAPGGKSTHIAQKIYPEGTVLSRDISEAKVSMIRENVLRLGLNNVRTEVYDASIPDGSLKESADIVIADLPCSGLGIIGKKPDIKYHASPEGCNELADIQKNILHVASSYVKKGGKLVYSTCTLNPDENIKNAEWFVKNHDYEEEDVAKFIPEGLSGVKTYDKCIEIIPGYNGMDGFFISSFIRK